MLNILLTSGYSYDIIFDANLLEILRRPNMCFMEIQMRRKMIARKRNILFSSVFPGLLLFIVQLLPSTCFGEKVPVVTSIYPVADMVRQVGGEHVDVTFVLPAGASPHTFEPKPSMVKKFSSARIFFMIGAGLEFWAKKFIRLSGPNLTTVVLSEGIPLIRTIGHQDNHEHGHGNTEGSDHDKAEFANPHIWLDPEIAKLMIRKITAALSQVDNGHSDYYHARGQIYLDELDGLDRQIRTTIESFTIKQYVSFHASWVYFAKRYGLEPVGVIEAAPGRNPTPMEIKNIVELIKKHRIRAVFAEPQFNPKVAEVIAREADIRMLMLDPVGGPNLRGRASYIDLMRYNLNVLQEAMK